MDELITIGQYKIFELAETQFVEVARGYFMRGADREQTFTTADMDEEDLMTPILMKHPFLNREAKNLDTTVVTYEHRLVPGTIFEMGKLKDYAAGLPSLPSKIYRVERSPLTEEQERQLVAGYNRGLAITYDLATRKTKQQKS